MNDYLRLRQICLAAPSLEPAVASLSAILELEVCHRDPNVAKYGLVNALFVFGQAFLEIVAPIDEASAGETAAGRFIDRSGGRGGYMAIFDCSDPERRRERALAMGVRLAHGLEHPGFWGSQLHPRDCRATMLEFDHSKGGDSLDGNYWPAGRGWQAFAQPEQVSGMPCFEVETPDPAGLAAHWSQLIDRPLETDAAGSPSMRFDLGAVRFVQVPAGSPERMSAISVAVADPQAVRQRAQAQGCVMERDGFLFAGVILQPILAA